jgi:hypothetical protein
MGAIVVDQLRHERGHGILLRGHDFLLRGRPTDTATVLTQESAKTPSRRVNLPIHRARVTGYIPLGVSTRSWTRRSPWSVLGISDGVIEPVAKGR